MKWIIVVSAAATAHAATNPVDVCTTLNATSVCMESGMCSNMRVPTSCFTAYNNVSMHAFRYHNESAIIANLRAPYEGMESFATLLSRNHYLPGWIDNSIPAPTGMYRIYHNFEKALENFKNVILRNFPYIRFVQNDDDIVIHSLVCAAHEMVRHPGYSDPSFRGYLLTGKLMSDIREAFRLIIEKISFCRRHDRRRFSIFFNTITFTHAWNVVNDLLRFPPPFYAPEYLEYLTAAARFDPYHTLPNREWTLSIPQFDKDEIATTLPIIELDMMIPLQFFDYFDLPHDTRLNDTRTISHILTRIGALPRQGRWMAIRFLSYNPVFSTPDRKKICDAFSVHNNYTIAFARINKPAIQIKMMNAILDLFQLCGETVLNLSVRMEQILPEILKRKTSNVEMIEYLVANASQPTVQDIIQIPLSVLRCKLRIRDRLSSIGGPGHVQYLTKFLRQYDPNEIRFLITSNAILDTSDQQLLEAVGIAVALLFVERDPTGVLRELYPNLGLPSESFRRGFCKVLNCEALERLFTGNERNLRLDFFGR